MLEPRSHAIDNLRTFLTVLVILHHAVLPYGGAGTWVYKSPHHEPGSSLPILTFNVTNQTFFMATFFLISSYFSSISARKRTRKAFLVEKLKRLGIPTLVYSVLAPPLNAATIACIVDGKLWTTVLHQSWLAFTRIRGVSGPVWYTALLLLFDALYALLRPSHFLPSQQAPAKLHQTTPLLAIHDTSPQPPLSTGDPPAPRPFSTPLALALLTLSALTAFLIRLPYPLGTNLPLISLQVGYAPQYILYYTAGIAIHRTSRSLAQALTPLALRITGVLVALLGVAGPVVIHRATQDSARGQGRSLSEVLDSAKGGWNGMAVVYALYNEYMGVLLATLVLKAFHSPRIGGLSRRWSVGRWDVARESYAAFLVHAPVLVGVQSLVGRVGWDSGSAVVLGTGVGVVGVLGSWVVGVVVRGGFEGVGGGGVL